MSNEFKVWDEQLGRDVTVEHDWAISSGGDLLVKVELSWSEEYKTVDPERYSIRRSTGISDKNERMLFEGECFKCNSTNTNSYQIHWCTNTCSFIARCISTSGFASKWWMWTDNMEYIEAES